MPIRWDMRDKTPQQQAIVAARDKSSSISRISSSSNINNLVYSVFRHVPMQKWEYFLLTLTKLHLNDKI